MQRSFWVSGVLVAVVATGGCLGGEEQGEPCQVDECGRCVPLSGEATLLARGTYDDYEAATYSFEQASAELAVVETNDWDLLFGNDAEEELDRFRVNTVVDDRSFIVDLGATSLGDVPEVVDPERYDLGLYGEHDSIPVVLGHLYVVRTVDTETRQYAAFRVLEHELNRQVTIRWFRSVEPDRFVPPAP